MSPSKAEFYRRQAEACCRKAIVVEDVGRRLHWLEAASRWISLGREEGALPLRQTSLARGTRCPKISASAKVETTAMNRVNAKTG
jgi:hypothetical protein